MRPDEDPRYASDTPPVLCAMMARDMPQERMPKSCRCTEMCSWTGGQHSKPGAFRQSLPADLLSNRHQSSCCEHLSHCLYEPASSVSRHFKDSNQLCLRAAPGERAEALLAAKASGIMSQSFGSG